MKRTIKVTILETKKIRKMIERQLKNLLFEEHEGDEDNPEGSDEIEDCSKFQKGSKEEEECKARNSDKENPP